MIPEFAVVGHPNEGKSSVLSTLAEDDSVKVSNTPGETDICQRFPVSIDGHEILAFVDTPGFQNPGRVLHCIMEMPKSGNRVVSFMEKYAKEPGFADEVELLQPIMQGAGIIYVVDGSRQIENVDRAEIEILRLTGQPRMAVINSKDLTTSYLEEWKEAFVRDFSLNRVFNAHRATWIQRLELLEAMKHMNQDWLQSLDLVIDAFKRDWSSRREQCVEIVLQLLTGALSLEFTEKIKARGSVEESEKRLHKRYVRKIEAQERAAHQQIRSLFKHRVFQHELPVDSIVRESLFGRRSWKFLGLSRSQLVLAGGMGGAAVGAGVDVAAAGITFGVFSALGGAIGAVGTLLKGRQILSGSRLLGMNLDRETIRVGPANTIQLLYILIDRALIYTSHIVNWSHGRRDYSAAMGANAESRELVPAEQGYTRSWSSANKDICQEFFQNFGKGSEPVLEVRGSMRDVLTESFAGIVSSER